MRERYGRTSIIWSRKGMPDSDEHTPVPSRPMLTSTCVSFVRRWTVPRRSALAAGHMAQEQSQMHACTT